MAAGNSRTRNYLSGLITGYTVTIAGVVVGLWLTPFVLRHLGREAYGVFALGSDVLGWLALLDIGISAGLNVHLARRSGRIEIDEISRYVSSTFFVQSALAVLMLSIGLIIAVSFPDFFDVSPSIRDDSVLLMGLLVLGSSLALGVRTFSAVLIAHQQIHIDNLIGLGLLILRTMLVVFLLRNGWGLLSLGIASLTAVSVTSLLAIWRVYRLLPGLRITSGLFSWGVLKDIWGVGVWFSLGALAGLVILNLDRVVAGKLVSLEAVTVLVLTGRLYSLVQGLLNQISNTARPALGQLLGQGKTAQALAAYRQIFVLSNGLAIVVGMAIFAGNREFVRAWVGNRNYGGTHLDMALFLNLMVNTWILPNRAILSSSLIVKPQTLSRIVEGILNIFLSIILTLKFGLIGVALSTSIAAFFTSFWYLPKLTAGLFGLPFLQFWRAEAGRLLVFLLIMIPFSFFGREISSEVQGFPGAAAGASVTGVCGLSILWVFVFDRMMRTRVLALLPYREVRRIGHNL